MKKKGFTLVEVIITAAIFTLLFAAVLQVYVYGTRFYTDSEQHILLRENGRRLLKYIMRDIRMSGEAIEDIVVDVDGENFDIETLDNTGNETIVTYSFGIDPTDGENTIYRNGRPACTYANFLNITSNGVEVTVAVGLEHDGGYRGVRGIVFTETMSQRNRT